ncbi:MAG: tetratricopeptide repeat protein [Rhodospirillales bacterium]|nr:tetratricopeptide repeat protein [Rhodospirillales bacterium]
MLRARIRYTYLFVEASFCLIASAAMAAEGCPSPVGSLDSVQGAVEVQRAGTTDWLPIGRGGALCVGDVVRVGELGRIEASLANQVKFRSDQNSTLRLISPPKEQTTLLGLLRGSIYFLSHQPRSLTVDTPFVNAAVEGTEFLIRVADAETLIHVFNGRVIARNGHGELALGNGVSGIARANEAPTDYLLVRPFDAVQWALYYPPVLPPAAAAPGLSPDLKAAVDLAGQDRTAEAFARFQAIPEADRGARFYLYRAQTLLSVGRVDEADADLESALARDPDDGAAYGLRAIIAVARNRRDEAMAFAQHGVELAPKSAAAKIALSYAQQSRFEIDAARHTLEAAVTDEPDNPLAWARLSELWLMLGYRDRAIETAKRAEELAPDFAKVQTVLGFAALSEIDTRRAERAFRRAIALDSASPQPRFGLGLATIRDGHLKRGRGEIEAAMLLDPGNSLLRSYLGKAYFEERTTDPVKYIEEMFSGQPRNEKLAAEQYDLAKELDPLDPTPYLYSAIEKQSENRPVEALHDIQKSIELNDNRAVYRSRDLLDQDQAARGTSLARIYNDLGFEQLGINEATKSLAYDPANAGAHRFLSDVYASQPRQEMARVSELLQAQLLQDVNINPVQPSLSETDVNASTRVGPTTPGFNEFTPLFAHNGAQLNTATTVGNRYTFNNEAVVSGLYDWISLSAGQFYSTTEGFRDNNQSNEQIYDIFAQAAVTPEINIQGEARRRYSNYGNVSIGYDPDIFDPVVKTDTEITSERVGARFTPAPGVNLIGSFIHTERHQNETPLRQKDDAIQGEIRQDFSVPIGNITAGVSAYNVDRRLRLYPDFLDEFNSDEHSHIQQNSGYIYTDIDVAKNTIATIGLGISDYHEADYQSTTLDPKLGLRWSPLELFDVRLSAFRLTVPSRTTRQTIEPTQIAGFNQFFDYVDGTDMWSYGAGIDVHLSKEISVGVEAIRQNLDEPVIFPTIPKTVHEDREQTIVSGYANWSPYNRVSLSAKILRDYYQANSDANAELPNEINTWSIPLTARYFDPSGLFGVVQGTIVHQNVNRSATSTQPEGDDGFFLLNMSVGYRLSERRGLAGCSVNNLLDKHFKYQDDNPRRFTGENINISPYIPERMFFCSVTFSL